MSKALTPAEAEGAFGKLIEKLVELRALPMEEEARRPFLGENDAVKWGFVALWCWKPVPKDASDRLPCIPTSGIIYCTPTPFDDTMVRCEGHHARNAERDTIAATLNEYLASVST